MRIVTEAEFQQSARELLLGNDGRDFAKVGSVTGPGRSGAIAAVYASHILGVPFIPYKTASVPTHLGYLLIIDTAMESGATMRKASRFYEGIPHYCLPVFNEPPRVAFWYEAAKPQRYRHERRAAA